MRGLIAIGFADLVGFTKLGEQLPPRGAGTGDRSAWRRSLARSSTGRSGLVKLIGDAAMFASADTTALLEATLELVETMAEEEDGFPLVRAGAGLGPAFTRGGRYYGRPVNLVSRITEVAQAGSVLVAPEVREHVDRGRLPISRTGRQAPRRASRGTSSSAGCDGSRRRATATARPAGDPTGAALIAVLLVDWIRRNPEAPDRCCSGLFALLAGAGTALSPCVLPVLPAVLSAGVTGGRRRPLGIVAGLTLSFTFAAVALVYVIDALGLPERPPADARDRRPVRLRYRAPGAAARRPGRGLDRRGRRRPRDARRRGLRLRADRRRRLGLVYVPCAGPILAGVITVSPLRTSPPPACGRSCVRGRLAPRCSTLLICGRRLHRSSQGSPAAGPGGHGRGDGRGRPADVRRPRRPLPERDRRRPAGLPRRPAPVSSRTRCCLLPARGPARQAAATRSPRAAGRGRQPAEAAGPRPGARLHRARRGSTRRRQAALDPGRPARPGRCWSTSGPTPASTASAPCPTSRPGTRATASAAWSWSACTRPSSHSSSDAGNVADAIDAERHHLPGRPGQRLRHLERLRQPVLAGQVPDRLARARPLRPLRRRRLRADRGGDPRAAGRARAPATRGAGTGCTPRPRSRAAHAGDLPRRGAGPGLDQRAAAARRGSKDYGRSRRTRCRRTASPTAAAGTSATRRATAVGRRAARPALPARGGSSWSSAHPAATATVAGAPRWQADLRRPAGGGRPAARPRSRSAPAPLRAGRPAAGRHPHARRSRFAPGIDGYAFTFG